MKYVIRFRLLRGLLVFDPVRQAEDGSSYSSVLETSGCIPTAASTAQASINERNNFRTRHGPHARLIALFALLLNCAHLPMLQLRLHCVKRPRFAGASRYRLPQISYLDDYERPGLLLQS